MSKRHLRDLATGLTTLATTLAAAGPATTTAASTLLFHGRGLEVGPFNAHFSLLRGRLAIVLLTRLVANPLRGFHGFAVVPHLLHHASAPHVQTLHERRLLARGLQTLALAHATEGLGLEAAGATTATCRVFSRVEHSSSYVNSSEKTRVRGLSVVVWLGLGSWDVAPIPSGA